MLTTGINIREKKWTEIRWQLTQAPPIDPDFHVNVHPGLMLMMRHRQEIT